MIMAKACLDKGFWMRMYGSALSADATTMPWASGAMLAKAVGLTSCRWASQKIPSGILTSSAKSWRDFFGCLSCLILFCRFPIVQPEAARCEMAACISLGMMSWSFGVNWLAKYFSSHQGSLARVARRTACQPILSMTVVALSVAFLSSTPQSFRSCATWAVMSWDPTPPNLSWLGMTNEWFIAWAWMSCSKRHLHVMASLGMKGRIRWPGVRKFYIKRSTHDPCKGLEPTVIVENSVDLDSVDSNVVPKPSRGNKEPISSWRGGDLDSSCMEFDGNWEPMVCNPNHGDDKPWHCVSWGKLANPPLQERFQPHRHVHDLTNLSHAGNTNHTQVVFHFVRCNPCFLAMQQLSSWDGMCEGKAVRQKPCLPCVWAVAPFHFPQEHCSWS